LFDGQAFEPARTSPLHNEPSSDPNAPTSKDFTALAFSIGRIYALFGAPQIVFPTNVGTSATLRLPVARLAFDASDPAVEIKIDVGRLAIELGNVRFSSSGNKLVVDMSTLGPDDIRFAYRLSVTESFTTADSDVAFAGILALIGITLAPDELATARQGIAQIVSTRFGRTEAPVDVGALGGATFDVALFGGEGGALQLRVPAGGGDRNAGGTNLRHDGQRFAVVVSRGLLDEKIASSVENLFPSAQSTFDVPVPPGTNTVLVFGPGEVIFAPIAGRIFSALNGKTKLLFAAGTFDRRTRGHIHNWTRGTSSELEVKDQNAFFEVSIDASAGERIGVTLDRRGLSGGQFTYKRPTYDLDSKEGIEFHSDLDAYPTDAPLAFTIAVRAALDPDPSQQFAVIARQAGVDVKGPTSVAAYFFGAVFGSVSITGWSLLDAFAINPLAAEKVSPLLDTIRGAFAFASPAQLALFLDELHLTEEGLYFGGNAEGGLLERSGRSIPTADQLMIATATTPVFAHWNRTIEPLDMTISAPEATVAGNFWLVGPDAEPPASAFALRHLTLPADSSVLTFVRSDRSLVKLLVDRTGPKFVWVVYPHRPDPAIALVDNVLKQTVSSRSSGILHVTELRYEGTIALDRTRVYLTDGTRARGRETWRWNGQPLDANVQTFPWGAVWLDPVLRVAHLRVEAGVADTPLLHTFEVQVTDVFGTQASVRDTVSTPTRVVSADPITMEYPWFRDPRAPLVDPLDRIGPLVRDDLVRIRETLRTTLETVERLGLAVGTPTSLARRSRGPSAT
jgi:hypothetical protein